MEVVIFPTDAANPAEVAVELAFVPIVVQTASGTEVKAKFDATFRTM